MAIAAANAAPARTFIAIPPSAPETEPNEGIARESAPLRTFLAIPRGGAGRLAPLEVGLPLLEERGHALAEVLGAEELQELQVDVVDVVVERLLHAHAHQPLGRLHRQRRV